MDRSEIVELFEQINVWQRDGQRAPHKPLLLLLALGKCWRDEERMLSYREVDDALRFLLISFGPSRDAHHPEYPFWRLRNDALWELEDGGALEKLWGNGDARRGVLLDQDIHGGLPESIYHAFQQDPRLLVDVADLLLERNFPPTLHDDIRVATGLDTARLLSSTRLPRDLGFRVRVLAAYDHKCALCGFGMRFEQRLVGLDAAHIRWHQAGGADTVDNGLALCSLHHKLFDNGVFTLSDTRQVLVSNLVPPSPGAEEWMIRFHDRPFLAPVDPVDLPGHEYLDWHRREVFKGVPRHA